jgi:hypothetical protein
MTDYDDPQDLNDHEALDMRVRTFMREHEEPDYGVALDRVLQLDELAAPAAEPAAPPNAESVFAGFVRAGVLEEGHRRQFLERYPPNALVFADPEPGWVEGFLASIRGTAEALGHVGPAVDDLQALEHEVHEHAREQDADFWMAAAAVTGKQQFTRHALPPDAPGLDETVREALRLARERDVDFIDGAQLAMYEQQLADVGVGSDRWRGLRRETFLERAQDAEAERRREALCSELRRRGRKTFERPRRQVGGRARRLGAERRPGRRRLDPGNARLLGERRGRPLPSGLAVA